MDQSADFVIDQNGVLKAYNGNDEIMIIPEGVKVIGKEIIGYRRGVQVKRIIVPEGVTEIMEFAFRNGNVSEITLPKSLKKIGNGAFDDCKNLKCIEIPEGITEIPSYAFCSSGLEEITLPDSVEEIGQRAFRFCRSLKKINFSKLATVKIGPQAFSGCDSLVNETGLFILQNRVFTYHSKIWNAYVVIPDGITEIELDAFASSGKIHLEMSLDCPSWVQTGAAKMYGFARSVLDYDGSSITFRDSEGKMAAYVVLAKDGETEPKKNGAVLSLKSENGKFDFEHYDSYFGSLTKVPNKIKVALARIEYPYELSKEMEDIYTNYLKRQGVTAGQILIDENNMEGLQKLADKGIFTANTVKKLTEYAKQVNKPEFTAWLLNYGDTNKMTKATPGTELSLTINDKKPREYEGKSVAEWKKLYRFNYDADGVIITEYKGHEKIVQIPGMIGNKKVVGLRYLSIINKSKKTKKIIIPGGISIEEGAFAVDNVEIEFLEGTTELPVGVFYGWDNSLTVKLPHSLKSMGKQLFGHRDEPIKYDRIHFIVPKGSYAEQRCKELNYIYEAIDVEPAEMVVPVSAAAASRKTAGSIKDWKKPKTGTHYVSRYLGEDTEVIFPKEVDGVKITGIANAARETPHNYRSIVSVELPEGYQYIGSKAFDGCEKLETIKLPSTIKEIGSMAFSNCKNLKEIILHKDISFTGGEIFFGAKIETVVFEGTKEKIPSHLFFECKIKDLVVYGGDFKSNGHVFDCYSASIEDWHWYDDGEEDPVVIEAKDNLPENVYIKGNFSTLDLKDSGVSYNDRIHPLAEFDENKIMDDTARNAVKNCK